MCYTPPLPKIPNYGPWTLNIETLELVHQRGYPINLEQARSPAAALDWIFQIHNKGWGDAETLFWLIKAFDELLDPQLNICSSGLPKTLSKTVLRRHIAHLLRIKEDGL